MITFAFINPSKVKNHIGKLNKAELTNTFTIWGKQLVCN